MTSPPEPAAPSAIPPRGARIAAFAAVLVGGLCGALIGYAMADLQCDGTCHLQKGLGVLVGGLLAAVGVALVAVLYLRATNEWGRPRPDA